MESPVAGQLIHKHSSSNESLAANLMPRGTRLTRSFQSLRKSSGDQQKHPHHMAAAGHGDLLHNGGGEHGELNGLAWSNYTQRSASLDRREEEVARLTQEILEHVQAVIEKTNLVEEKEMEIRELQSEMECLEEENATLKMHLQESQNQVEEKELMIQELQRLLMESRHKIAESRMDMDKFKVQHVILEDHTDGVPLSEYTQLQHQLKLMQEEVARLRQQQETSQVQEDEARQKMEKLKDRNQALFATLERFHRQHPMLNENDDDEEINQRLQEGRTKRQLLAQIRQIQTDKIAWESYACNLVRKVIRFCPHLLESDPHVATAAAEQDSVPENGWEHYALSLMGHIMCTSPSLMESFCNDKVNPTPATDC